MDERWAQVRAEADERVHVLKGVILDLSDQFEQIKKEAFPLLQTKLDDLTVDANAEYCSRLNQYGERAEALVNAMDDLLKVKREETVVMVKVSDLPGDLREKFVRHLRHMKMSGR